MQPKFIQNQTVFVFFSNQIRFGKVESSKAVQTADGSIQFKYKIKQETGSFLEVLQPNVALGPHDLCRFIWDADHNPAVRELLAWADPASLLESLRAMQDGYLQSELADDRNSRVSVMYNSARLLEFLHRLR